MNILAIETATAVCGAAVVSENGVLAQRHVYAKHIHSEKLVTLVDAVLRQSGECDAVAVSIGPGSFTGLRIGLSVAKGFAYATHKPLVAVPTLEALALRPVQESLVHNGDGVLALIDARRNDVYAGLFAYADDRLVPQWDATAMSLDMVFQRLPDDRRIVVVGDAVEKFSAHASFHRDLHVIIPPAEQRLCHAGTVGMIGLRKALAKEYADLALLEPLYIKDFVTLVTTQHVSP